VIYVIFENVLANHTWTETGRLRIVQPKLPASSNQPASPEAESQSLLSRLLLRSKSDRIMARAARQLSVSPSMRLDLLALELGVSERYLLTGLRAILGASPDRLARSLSMGVAA
jgi:AraC-like DNA-binding protein